MTVCLLEVFRIFDFVTVIKDFFVGCQSIFIWYVLNTSCVFFRATVVLQALKELLVKQALKVCKEILENKVHLAWQDWQ